MFKWFERNYVQVLRLSATTTIDWQKLADEFAVAGITDRTGQPATANTVKTTWYRVKRSMRKRAPLTATAPPAPAAPLHRHPSRSADTWQPPLAGGNQHIGATPPAPVAPTTPTVAHRVLSEPQRTVADMTPDESMYEALREMDQRANRKLGIR